MARLTFETPAPATVAGASLAADIIRPATGRHPAVVVRTPYDRKTAASTALQVSALRLAEAGYAVVIQDVRGEGESAGVFDPFVNEAVDGIATIEWVADQRWCTGAVGMAGISYLAYCQTAVAAAGLEQLRAWVPALAPFDVPNGWIREGGALQSGFHAALAEQGVIDQSILRHWQAEPDPQPG